MSKLRTVHRCQACGSSQPRWAGRCPVCGEWNSLREEAAPTALEVVRGVPKGGPGYVGIEIAQPLSEVDLQGRAKMPTHIGELDRVLAGGFLPGSSTLLGGEPGTGKSTLLLQALASMAREGRRCLLVAAEESAHQVRRRADRLGANTPGLFVVETAQLPAVLQAVGQLAPEIVVVDSVQALSNPEVTSSPGSVGQVRDCSLVLAALAKSANFALILVGHVTKDGGLAGPRALEHLVDTVLSFEGDRYLSLRALRAIKHRFGPTGEMGLFEMGESGLSPVADPSALFLGDRLAGSSGSAVTVTMEGYRPVLVEVQALVGRQSTLPRRLVTGASLSRVAFLVAVLDRRAGVRVDGRDTYVSVAGGARVSEPAADLAICLAIASSVCGQPVPPDVVCLGEIGLGGELRRVGSMSKRLAEARRLGFSRALVPGSDAAAGNLVATTLRRALSLAFGGDVTSGRVPAVRTRRPRLSVLGANSS